MKYITGEDIILGDNVLIENKKTQGVVYAISDTLEQAEQWGLNEIGISIESDAFGLVFYPMSEINDPVIFFSRKSD